MSCMYLSKASVEEFLRKYKLGIWSIYFNKDTFYWALKRKLLIQDPTLQEMKVRETSLAVQLVESMIPQSV